jgi:hypothetical protein
MLSPGGQRLTAKNQIIRWNGNHNLKTLVENLQSRLDDFTKKPPTIAVLLLIQGISTFLWWVAGSYLGFDIYSSKIYWSADGACDPTTQGLGVHCWSDYYYLITALESGNPYSASESTLYPAAGLAPFMVFKLLTDFTGISWLGLAAYLFTMTALIAYSVWFATKGQSFERRVLLFSALVLLSPAVLATLDRGNSVGFLIPTLVWLFSSIQNQKPPQTVMALALLSLIKPHYGVVALAFILAGRVKVGSWALGIGATLNLLAFFVFWPREFPNNLLIWANTLFGYQDYATVTGLWPQNISFSQSIYLMFYSVDVASGGQLQPVLNFIESRQGLWGPLTLLLVLALIFAFRKNLTIIQTSIIVVSAVSMTSAISYYYYIVIAIPFLLTLHNASKSNSEFTNELKQHESQATRSRKVNFALWFASIFTLVQFPVLIAQETEYTITTAPFIGGVWIFCYLYIFVVNVQSKQKS